MRKSFKPFYHNRPGRGICVAMEPAFDVHQFGLGGAEDPDEILDVIAVMFDLEGFTAFTRQIQQEHEVSTFISQFLVWLFDAIKCELTIESERGAGGNLYYAEFPFYAKFTGDGVLLLWHIDMKRMGQTDPDRAEELKHDEAWSLLGSIVAAMQMICSKYPDFLRLANPPFHGPPLLLRCGIARGKVRAVCAGNDYVGVCINIASRLQKCDGFSFAFLKDDMGFDLWPDNYRTKFVQHTTTIRGIPDPHVVYVLQREAD